MELYLESLYWAVQTITTVGYGDNTISTHHEQIFCIFAMVIGVIAFSLGTGTLANIIHETDEKNAV